MSLTALKDCFKAVYGKPIHAFQREYKMQAATKLLISTSLSITEIAGRLGYENPNKFSTSFKEIIGQSPSEYRKQRGSVKKFVSLEENDSFLVRITI